MSTPRKIKRYDPGNLNAGLSGNFTLSCDNPQFATRLAQIISQFVHLEQAMVSLVAVLLGDSDDGAAGYVYRAIKSPRGRVDLMNNLLRLAPNNRLLGEEYDHLIDEFWSLNIERNKYAHGQWWTKAADNSVYICEFDEHGRGLASEKARPVSLAELNAVLERIYALHLKLWDIPALELEKRRRRGQPKPPQASVAKPPEPSQ